MSAEPSTVVRFPNRPAAPVRTKIPTHRELVAATLPPGKKSDRIPVGPNFSLALTRSSRGDVSKIFQFRYTWDGQERTRSLGSFPEVSLAEATKVAADMRIQLARGIDPFAEREEKKIAERIKAITFEVVAREWLDVFKSRWSGHTVGDVVGGLEKEVFPKIGAKPIAEVTPTDCIAIMRAIEPRSVDIARRIRARMDSIFAYAIAHGHCPLNPAQMIKAAMAPMPKGGLRPAILEIEPLREMLMTVEAYPAAPSVKAAHRFLALTAMRPGEVYQAKWEQMELDGDRPVWRIPADAMKMDREHIVPLSRQAVELLLALHPYTGMCSWVFPAAQGPLGPLSENTIGHVLDRAGYRGKHCAHGWRASFSTIWNDLHPTDAPLVEAALAHAKGDAVAARYNRGEYLEQRRPLMQAWADLLLQGAMAAEELLAGRRRR